MVAGGAITVTGTPPDISQAPPHWAAVSGPQPVVSGRELEPPPMKCGPGLVAMLLGPPVHAPLLHKPLAQSAASLQSLPLAMSAPPGESLPEPLELPDSLLPQAEAPKRPPKSAIAASVE